MPDQFQGIEPMVYKSKINVPYSWWAGASLCQGRMTDGCPTSNGPNMMKCLPGREFGLVLK